MCEEERNKTDAPQQRSESKRKQKSKKKEKTEEKNDPKETKSGNRARHTREAETKIHFLFSAHFRVRICAHRPLLVGGVYFFGFRQLQFFNEFAADKTCIVLHKNCRFCIAHGFYSM